jgi:hypothetical protein
MRRSGPLTGKRWVGGFGQEEPLGSILRKIMSRLIVRDVDGGSLASPHSSRLHGRYDLAPKFTLARHRGKSCSKWTPADVQISRISVQHVQRVSQCGN